MDINKIEQLNIQYASEKAELMEQLKSNEIDKKLYKSYLEQLVQNYNMDLTDITLGDINNV